MKNLYILTAILLLFTSQSCTKEIHTTQPPYTDSREILPTSWRTSDYGYSYYVDIPVKDVDDNILKDGAVLVYLSFDKGRTYESLPEVYKGVFYGVIHSQGKVTIILESVFGEIIEPFDDIVTVKIVIPYF